MAPGLKTLHHIKAATQLRMKMIKVVRTVRTHSILILLVTELRNYRNILVVLLLGILLELLLIVSHHVSYAFYGCKGQVVLLLIVVRGRLYRY